MPVEGYARSLSRGNITQSGSSIRHALTTIRRNRNSLSTCTHDASATMIDPDVPLFGENTEVRQDGGGEKEKYSISNISHSLFSSPGISPLQNSVSSPCSAYKFRSPFACFSNMYRYEWQSLPYLVTSTPPEYIAYLEELFLDISLFAKFPESAVCVIRNTILTWYARYIFDDYV